MAHQREFQPTLYRTVNTAPELTAENENSHQQVALLFERMFDTLALALCDETHEFIYDTGGRNKGKPIDKFPFCEMVPVYAQIPTEEIIESTRQDLALYTKGTLRTGILQFDTGDFPEEDFKTYDDVCKAYVKDGTERAIERYNQARLDVEYPEHITISEADEEANSRFAGVIRDFGHAAVTAIKNGTESIISRPIFTTLAGNGRINEATPGYTVQPEDVTDGTLTGTDAKG